MLASCVLAVAIQLPAHGKPPAGYSRSISIIAFGSCNKHDAPQEYWSVIDSNNPDLWIWLGDIVYADTEDMPVMESKYDAQFSNVNYRVFRENTQIIGIWDDHDYGENNAGKWYPRKRESQQLLLDFLEAPPDDIRRMQEGVHIAYEFGSGKRRVLVILLDVRYHADRPGEDADILGEEQWRFLEHELKQSRAQLVLIGSGIQVLSQEHKWEKWANFPRSRERLLKLIQQSGVEGVVFLSGDRHMHEISVMNDETTPYPLIDITSSGLTHSYPELLAEKNPYRAGDMYTGKGFGLITIDWDSEMPTASLQIRDLQNRIRNQFDIPLNVLRPNKDL
ncbi:MAG: alkaline phosphatase family protein [Verrucomicrobia bacterium]|nr:alkaline phosphatase family protein [Verrucomicrobiota bacterium]